MPARLIRDGLLDSERVCGLPLEARWLFVTICLQADDVGLFDAAPFALMRKAELQRDLGPRLLAALVDVDLIRLYESAEFPGKRFGFVPRYGQRLRLTKMKHPLPPLALVADDPAASRKIKYLASKMTAGRGNLRPEAEAEAEDKRKLSEVILPTVGGSADAPAPPAPPKVKKAAKKASTKKPTPTRRAPKEFLVDGPLQKWAREEAPLVDIRAETATFRDHEFGKAKSDWPATWRNWMRTEQKKLATVARRSSGSSSAKSFRQTDGEQIASSLSKLTGGLLGRRPSPQGEILDMENPDVRIGSD